jgi:hypothetical protein
LGFAVSPPARAILATTLRPRRHTKNFADLVAAAIPEHARGKPIELWWQDEKRVLASKAP